MYVFPFYGSKFMYIESSYYLFSSKKHNTIIYNKVQLVSPIYFLLCPLTVLLGCHNALSFKVNHISLCFLSVFWAWLNYLPNCCV